MALTEKKIHHIGNAVTSSHTAANQQLERQGFPGNRRSRSLFSEHECED